MQVRCMHAHTRALLLFWCFVRRTEKNPTTIVGGKETVSFWFGETLGHPFDRAGQIKHLASIRPLAMQAIQNRQNKQAKDLKIKIGKEIKNYPFKNVGVQKLFLAGLYWAEGAKHKKVSGLKFINTDPKLALLYLTLLRKCYNIDESKLRIGLHLHYYHKIGETKKFWSKLLNISEERFWKVYLKKRSITKKFRRNFAGICFIHYGSSDIRRELIEISEQFSELMAQHKLSSFNG